MTIHKELAKGKWFTMPLAEQMGNIGSEVDRIISWQKKNNPEMAEKAFCRALDLIDLTKLDPKCRGPKLRELCRVREVLCDAFLGVNAYDTPLEYFSKYFLQFAVLARKNR